jgi:hypothetical protein
MAILCLLLADKNRYVLKDQSALLLRLSKILLRRIIKLFMASAILTHTTQKSLQNICEHETKIMYTAFRFVTFDVLKAFKHFKFSPELLSSP